MSSDTYRALVLLRSAGSTDRAALRDVMSRATETQGGVVVRAWVEVDADPLAGSFGALPFDAVLDVESRNGPEALIQAFDRAKLDQPAIDRAASVVVAGRVRTLDPGERQLGLFFCMKPKAGMSAEEFSAYWHDVHAQHHAHRDGSGYQQLHADHELSTRVARAAGLPAAPYAGVAIAAVEALPPVSGGRADRGDRENFVDPETETGMIVERVF